MGRPGRQNERAPEEGAAPRNRGRLLRRRKQSHPIRAGALPLQPRTAQGLGNVTKHHHGKVKFTPRGTQFGDGWFEAGNGTAWKRARIEDDGNQGVTDPRHVFWAGEKEFKGKEKVAPAEYDDWKRLWAENYKRHNCLWFVGPTAPGAGSTRKLSDGYLDHVAATKVKPASTLTFRCEFPYAFQPRSPGQAFLAAAQAAITQRIRLRPTWRERKDYYWLRREFGRIYIPSDPKAYAEFLRLIARWRIAKKNYFHSLRERGDMRTELRLIGRHVVTGRPVWAVRTGRIMDKTHFEDNFYGVQVISGARLRTITQQSPLYRRRLGDQTAKKDLERQASRLSQSRNSAVETILFDIG